MSRLKKLYHNQVVLQLQQELKLKNINSVPKIIKITLNMGIGEAVNDKKMIDHAVTDMELISGQKALVTYARKSIAGFKLREGWPLGCKVTLRSERMWQFLDRLIDIAIPRIRDFRGMNPKSFDGRGNYSMGIREQIIFPEIDYEKINKLRGMDITISTTANNNHIGYALLNAMSFPFKR